MSLHKFLTYSVTNERLFAVRYRMNLLDGLLGASTPLPLTKLPGKNIFGIIVVLSNQNEIFQFLTVQKFPVCFGFVGW